MHHQSCWITCWPVSSFKTGFSKVGGPNMVSHVLTPLCSIARNVFSLMLCAVQHRSLWSFDCGGISSSCKWDPNLTLHLRSWSQYDPARRCSDSRIWIWVASTIKNGSEPFDEELQIFQDDLQLAIPHHEQPGLRADGALTMHEVPREFLVDTFKIRIFRLEKERESPSSV